MGAALLGYSVVSYLLFLAASVYLVLFLGGDKVPLIHVPKTLDWGPGAAPGAPATLMNIALLALFAAQHTVMARPGFKRALTRFIPAAAERSTFVLAP
jgi:protein-S-isoprenylcysteine O-methyltransferase Ste14